MFSKNRDSGHLESDESKAILGSLELQLKEKDREIRGIKQISAQFISTLELQEIFDIILDSTELLLNVRNTMILLMDEKGKALTLSASRGYKNTETGMEIPCRKGFIGKVIAKKKITTADISFQDSEDSPDEDMLPALKNVQSRIGVPLIIKERLLGIILCESTKPDAFKNINEPLLEFMAEQGSGAMVNSLLFQEQKEQFYKLEKVNTELTILKNEIESNKKGTSSFKHDNKESYNRLINQLVPQDLIPEMLKGHIKAQKKNASIMFADLEGFTKYSSVMEPDEIFSQLNYFLNRIGEHTKSFHGYVNKSLGDGIMALFGVPRDVRTHALEAVLTSLFVLKEVQHRFRLNMRIGIHSGPVFMGVLGTAEKNTYDALGHTVNIARGIENVAKPGEILISEYTKRMIDRFFNLEDMGEIMIEGGEKVHCHKVLGVLELDQDDLRVSATSNFCKEQPQLLKKVHEFKEKKLKAIDILSIQTRDGAINHNEAIASYALGLYNYCILDLKTHSEEIKKDLLKINRDEIITLGLLHDMGKYAIDRERLNDRNLSPQKTTKLRNEMLEETITIFKRLGFSSLVPYLKEIYAIDEDREYTDKYSLISIIVALPDVYDALTSPKLYKEKPWSVEGALEEMLNMSNLEKRSSIFWSFIQLMKPADAQIKSDSESNILFR